MSSTRLHKAHWPGDQEYRQVAGPGIPDEGDANDLLCHHFPDLSAAHAALNALPSFEPLIKRTPPRKPTNVIDHGQSGWDTVKKATRIDLGIGPADFKSNGFSKNFRCRNPEHEAKNPSAGWHEGGYLKCFSCGAFSRQGCRQVAGQAIGALFSGRSCRSSPRKQVDPGQAARRQLRSR